jgi:hypothetical protein
MQQPRHQNGARQGLVRDTVVSCQGRSRNPTPPTPWRHPGRIIRTPLVSGNGTDSVIPDHHFHRPIGDDRTLPKSAFTFGLDPRARRKAV